MNQLLQEKWDNLQKQLQTLESEVKESGFFIHEGKVQQDRVTYGLFWEMTYLYDYLEDGIYLCSYSKNAMEISELELKALIKALKEKDFDTSSKLLNDKTYMDSDVIDKIEEIIIDLDFDGNNFEIEVDLDDEDEELDIGYYVDGSTFSIRKCLLSDIIKTEKLTSNTTYNS